MIVKRIAYSKAAYKTLKSIPANWNKRIRAKIRAYADDPTSQANNVKMLQGSSRIRLRVGDWRVIMNDEGTVLLIDKISPRGGACRP